MFKVLKEVRDDVIDVMISSDGSWKSIMESDDHTEKPKDKTPDFAQDSPQRGSDGLSNAHSDVLDLTEIDDEMNPMTTAETENSKSLASINVQNTTVVINQSEISQTGASYVANDFWPGMYLTSLQTGGASEPARANFLQPPVLTDTISPALNPEGNGLIPTSVLQSGSSPNILQLQQFQFGNSSISNEYGMFPSASRDVNGTPVAVTAQMQTPVCHQRQQNTMNPLFHTGPSAATQDLRTESLDGSNLRSVLERQQFSFPGLNLLQARMTSSALPQQMTAQHSLAPLQPSQLVVGHQTPNLRTPDSTSQSQGPTQQSTWDRWEALKRRSSPVGIARATGFAGGQHAPIVSTQQTTQVVRRLQTPRTPSPLPGSADGFRTPLARDNRGHTGGTTPVTRSDSSRDSLLDPNWRPTGRMRGSLSGRGYSEALNQYIHKPTQQAQVPRPSIPPNMRPQLEVLLANRIVHTHAANHPSPAPANAYDISGLLPELSSGMQ